MSTSYSNEIAILEAEYQLEAQKNSLKRVEIECLRAKQKIELYDETKQSLYTEIEKTEEKLKSLKGGDK